MDKNMEFTDRFIDRVCEKYMPDIWHINQDSVDTTVCSTNMIIEHASYLPFGEEAMDHRSLNIYI